MEESNNHYSAIMDQAKKKETITYEDYCRKYRFPFYMNNKADRANLGKILNRVCDDYYEQEDDIMISVIIVKKSTSRPGEGFFKHAREKGYMKPGVTDEQFFEEQKNKFFNRFGGK